MNWNDTCAIWGETADEIIKVWSAFAEDIRKLLPRIPPSRFDYDYPETGVCPSTRREKKVEKFKSEIKLSDNIRVIRKNQPYQRRSFGGRR